MITYSDNKPIQLGDVVAHAGMRGTVVGIIPEGVYKPPYLRTDWSYLNDGIIVVYDEAGLIHHPMMMIKNLVLVKREK